MPNQRAVRRNLAKAAKADGGTVQGTSQPPLAHIEEARNTLAVTFENSELGNRAVSAGVRHRAALRRRLGAGSPEPNPTESRAPRRVSQEYHPPPGGRPAPFTLPDAGNLHSSRLSVILASGKGPAAPRASGREAAREAAEALALQQREEAASKKQAGTRWRRASVRRVSRTQSPQPAAAAAAADSRRSSAHEGLVVRAEGRSPPRDRSPFWGISPPRDREEGQSAGSHTPPPPAAPP
eukprot:Hpha_TRINITY_DN18013_c0_g1::TRINITY_DN18013_c0_g1_i1::g.1203::m.1203